MKAGTGSLVQVAPHSGATATPLPSINSGSRNAGRDQYPNPLDRHTGLRLSVFGVAAVVCRHISHLDVHHLCQEILRRLLGIRLLPLCLLVACSIAGGSGPRPRRRLGSGLLRRHGLDFHDLRLGRCFRGGRLDLAAVTRPRLRAIQAIRPRLDGLARLRSMLLWPLCRLHRRVGLVLLLLAKRAIRLALVLFLHFQLLLALLLFPVLLDRGFHVQRHGLLDRNGFLRRGLLDRRGRVGAGQRRLLRPALGHLRFLLLFLAPFSRSVGAWDGLGLGSLCRGGGGLDLGSRLRGLAGALDGGGTAGRGLFPSSGRVLRACALPRGPFGIRPGFGTAGGSLAGPRAGVLAFLQVCRQARLRRAADGVQRRARRRTLGGPRRRGLRRRALLQLLRGWFGKRERRLEAQERLPGLSTAKQVSQRASGSTVLPINLRFGA